MFKKALKTISGFAQNKFQENTSGKMGKEQFLSTNYDKNIKFIRGIFNLCDDVIFREFKVNLTQPLRACVIFVSPLADQKMITKELIASLIKGIRELTESLPVNISNLQQVICENLLISSEVSTTSDFLELEKKMMQGNSVLVLEGISTAIIVGTRGGEVRAIEQPDSEPAVRGSRDGFVERLDTNVCLIRRRINTSRLKCEIFQLGQLSKTRIAICYIQGIVNDKVVEEVKLRINRINTPGILDSNYIEEFIVDEPFSVFPLVQYTERPDKSAGALLEGKICIIVDNAPNVLIVPVTIISLLQASEDYNNNWIFATFIRLLRLTALNVALLFPASTVALFAFHQDMVPAVLLDTVATTRQNVPFPIFIEIFFMELTFELLQEAGVRLPRIIGQSVSTVGGLVIGQAAISAGFVSPVSVIVVAITAIANFVTSNYALANALRLFRFFMLILAGLLGGVGIIIGIMAILGHLCSLRSFGVMYLSPLVPLSAGDLKDTMVRVPLWAMFTRPRFLRTKEPVKQGPNQGPVKPEEEVEGE